MTVIQAQSSSLYCPRCGSLMYKPAGSSFYWHAENNHPPCTITNIAHPAKSEEVVPANQESKSRKGMSKRLS
jgi:hypothetical protein